MNTRTYAPYPKTGNLGAAGDKSPLDFAWFVFDFYNSNGDVVGRWGPIWQNVGAMTLLVIPGLTAQRVAAIGFGFNIAGAVRADVWIFEASHTDPSQNTWRIFARTAN